MLKAAFKRGLADRRKLIAAMRTSEHHRKCEQFITEWGPAIRAMARRVASRLPACLELEDLISVGMMGLMDAMDRYDPTRGSTFRSYAYKRIRGAMLDEVRSVDWTPRSAYQKFDVLEKARRALTARLGRPPQHDEVATALGMSAEVLHDFTIQARAAVTISMDDLSHRELDGRNVVTMLVDTHTPDPLSSLVKQRERDSLAEGIRMLPTAKARRVLKLYYSEGLTLKEIGTQLRVTEGRICQIHSAAMIRLKQMIADGQHTC